MTKNIIVLGCREMRIALLDYNKDVNIYRDIIVQSMKKLNVFGIVDCFISISSMEKQIRKYNVIFIHLSHKQPEYISYAKKLHDMYSEINIVLFSDEDEYVWTSFDIDVVYYIRKRFFLNEIDTVLLKLLGIVQRQEEELISLQSGMDNIQFKIHDIIYIEANRKSSYVIYGENVINVKMSFSSLEKIFLEKGFLKIHRSYMVNYRHIYRINGKFLTTDMGNSLPISKYRTDEVREKYVKLINESSGHIVGLDN